MKEYRRGGTYLESGHMAEIMRIGGPDIENPDYQDAYDLFKRLNKPLIEKRLRGEPLSADDAEHLLREAALLVEKFPADNPTNPKHPILRNIRIALIDALKLKREDEMNRIKAYGSIRTPIDVLCGGDFFIRVDPKGKDGAPAYILFDWTENSGKRTTRGDVLVKEVPDFDEDRAGFFRAITAIGSDAHRFYLRREMAEDAKKKYGSRRAA